MTVCDSDSDTYMAITYDVISHLLTKFKEENKETKL